jgi:hypothetical protein
LFHRELSRSRLTPLAEVGGGVSVEKRGERGSVCCVVGSDPSIAAGVVEKTAGARSWLTGLAVDDSHRS